MGRDGAPESGSKNVILPMRAASMNTHSRLVLSCVYKIELTSRSLPFESLNFQAHLFSNLTRFSSGGFASVSLFVVAGIR